MEVTKVTVVKYGDRKNLVLRWTDPETGRVLTKSARTSRRREAERAAASLESEIASGKHGIAASLTWQEFRTFYEEDCLSGLADKTFSIAQTTFKAVERLCHPQKLTDLTALRITAMQTKLRKEEKSESTIACYTRHLLAALNWAHDHDLLVNVPKVKSPRRAKGQKVMKGRPITTEEFERMLQATSKVVEGNDAANSWKHYLEGLWWSGLRLSESLDLYWDERPDKIHVDLTGRRPMMRIPAACEKGNRDRILPIAPEFAEFLLRTPDGERQGRVFKLKAPSGRASWSQRSDKVSAVVRRIGEAALVVVDERVRQGKPRVKYASAHDLRRSFGERWATKVMPQVLMELMRHESFETTQKFYVGRNAERTADVLWAAAQQSAGNTFGNSGRSDVYGGYAENPETLAL